MTDSPTYSGGQLRPTHERQHPDFTTGNLVALRHGAWSDRLVRPRALEIARALADEGAFPAYLAEPRYRPAVMAYATTLARIERLETWLEDQAAEGVPMELEQDGQVKAATGLELTPDELALIWREPPNSYWARTALGHVISARLGVHFYEPAMQEREHTNTHGHDGAMVPVLAAGPGAERFQGLYENTEIPRRIAAVMGLELRGAGEGAGTGRRSFK